MNRLTELIAAKARHTPDVYAFRFLEDGENDTAALAWRALRQREAAVAAQLQALARHFIAKARALDTGSSKDTTALACASSSIADIRWKTSTAP